LVQPASKGGDHANSQSRKYREHFWSSDSPHVDCVPHRVLRGNACLRFVFWGTRYEAWARASIWLLGAGIVMGALAAVAGLTDFIGDRRIRDISDGWQHAIGNVIVVLIQLFSFYERYRYGTGAVLPIGLICSAVVVCILLFTGWKGWEMVYRHRVAVSDDPAASPATTSHQRRAA
jgi:uncharacterized membrane protein